MPSDAKDLQVVLMAQEKRDLAPNVSSQVVAEMKSSLIFQFNWEELLQSAPTAISCMGACFIVSSSPRAVVQLKPPKDKGFQYLRYTSVQANLVECGNMGRYAFLEAENGMGIVQLTSQVINGKINEIVAVLGDPVSAKKLLRPQLETLKKGGKTCLDQVIAMDKKFEDWLLYVCEMHAACVQEENDTREAALSNEMCLAAESTRLDYAKSTVEEAKKASELLGKQVGTASEAFKKASDEFPTGWDIMGQQIVGDLASALTTGLNAAIPALLDNLNPMTKIKAGADVVGGFVNPKKDTPAAGANPNGDSGPVQQPPPPNAVPKQLSDPAYPEVLKINTHLAMLQVIVSGKDTAGEIDWERARGAEGKASSSIKFVPQCWQMQRPALHPMLPLQSQVASELEKVVEESGNMSQSWPDKNSAQAKKWQSDFAAQYRKANSLIAAAKTIPGGSAGGVPIMAADPALQTAQINAKSAQAQAVLESAKNRLTTTTQMLTTAQENYVKTTGMLLEQQNKLGDIQANLTRLTASNLSLKEIKSILVECIKLIINLKQQITNLVRFFKAISAIVEVCIKYHVEPFLETVKLLVAADGTDPYKELKIGDFTFTDFQRSQVYSAAVTMRSYFGVFGDIAKMWVQLSKENVMPGLKMCDELSVTTDEKDPAQMKKKVADLDRWSKEAAARVSQVAREKQSEIMDGMESRIAGVKETTTQIEAPPESTLKAITAGADVTKQAAQDSIVQRKQQSPFSRFAIIED